MSHAHLKIDETVDRRPGIAAASRYLHETEARNTARLRQAIYVGIILAQIAAIVLVAFYV